MLSDSWSVPWYQEVRNAAQETMRDLIREMRPGICDCPGIEDKLAALSEVLKDTKGKKVCKIL